jgi:hypothetical protein
VYGHMRAFLRDGLWESIRHHCGVTLREGAGREASPTAAVVDTRSVKTTESGGPRGWDAAKLQPRSRRGRLLKPGAVRIGPLALTRPVCPNWIAAQVSTGLSCPEPLEATGRCR